VRLLAIDTASGLCSAALWLDGELLLREWPTAREHAQRILPMVDDLLATAGLGLGQIDAIAFGRGPGSFTGLRIAASVTQGLAAGAGLPVVPVSDLRALAAAALAVAESEGGERPVAAAGCLDARMGEVYWGCFAVDAGGALSREAVERVLPPADVPSPVAGSAGGGLAGAGRGFEAYPELADRLGIRPGWLLASAEPRAADIVRLAVGDFTDGLAVDAAEAIPVYLRDNVAHPGALRR
jgi:tRNA threonylcarbamoyladenosine biosynthesis protein TsaB